MNRLGRLRDGLAAHVENLVLFKITGSTHALARTLIARQDGGEGRGNREWESPAGGLYMSWLRSGLAAETIAQLPMLAAAAAQAAVTGIGVPNARIKWPNDILVNGSKLAGLLVFARHGETSWVTIGLGVNLETAPIIDNSDALPATSVADHVTKGDVDSWRHDIVCTFVTVGRGGVRNPGRSQRGRIPAHPQQRQGAGHYRRRRYRELNRIFWFSILNSQLPSIHPVEIRNSEFGIRNFHRATLVNFGFRISDFGFGVPQPAYSAGKPQSAWRCRGGPRREGAFTGGASRAR